MSDRGCTITTGSMSRIVALNCRKMAKPYIVCHAEWSMAQSSLWQRRQIAYTFCDDPNGVLVPICLSTWKDCYIFLRCPKRGEYICRGCVEYVCVEKYAPSVCEDVVRVRGLRKNLRFSPAKRYRNSSLGSLETRECHACVLCARSQALRKLSHARGQPSVPSKESSPVPLKIADSKSVLLLGSVSEGLKPITVECANGLDVYKTSVYCKRQMLEFVGAKGVWVATWTSFWARF
ncbi:hypothetical protein Tco_0795696 [Tanacetum coccineum]